MAKKVENNMSLSDMGKLITTGELKNVYLIYGEEEYLKNYFAKMICKRLEAGPEAVTRLEGKVKAADLEEASEVSPMFAETTVVIAKNTGLFKNAGKGDGEDFSFLEELDPMSCIIFLEDAADKRNGVYRIVEKCGAVLNCPLQPESEIVKILVRRAKSNGRSIRSGAISLLFAGVGKDINTLLNEVDKLCLLVEDGGTVTEEHVKFASELSVEARVFDLTDGIAEKNCEKAMRFYQAMLADKTPVPVILTVIAKHFIGLYNTCCLLEEHCNSREIAEKLKINEFVAQKYTRQLRFYNRKSLADAVDYIAGVDVGIKAGTLDPETAVELIIQTVAAM